jgi:glyoxylase-like metal-dependent hydrolase (beta-lactamase superfamily II)
LVIDANFPSGAQEVLPKIRAQTDRPIRFVFDTHHHGDHAYANQFWQEQGAVIVGHEGVLAEMKRVETGYFGTTPGSWEGLAKGRPDVAQSKFRPPSLLFPRELILADRQHRVELRHFGVAHTRGDGFAWLPAERILFTGDACVNGPYNYMGDGHSGDWVSTLEKARALNPRLVCPGHGRMGGPEVLDQQIAYLKALRAEVRQLVDAQKTPTEVKAAVETLRTALRQQSSIAPYLGNMFASQVEKVFVEMGGKPFETARTPHVPPTEPGGRFAPADDREVVLNRTGSRP